MANEMLTGLLNQTSGGNWWGGSGAPTSGYGSFTPTPPSPQQAAPEAPAAPADPTGQPAQPAPGQGTPPPTPKPDNPAVQKAKMNIQRAQPRILQYKKQIIQYQGTEYGAKIQKYLQQMMLDIEHWQSIIASGGAGYR